LTDRTKSSDPKADWETRAGFHPSWFNVIEDSWFDGSRVHLWSSARPTNLLQGPPIFGTLIVRNKVRQPHATRTTFAWNFHTDGGILVGNRSGRDGYIPADPNAPAKPETRRVAVSHTLVTDNQVSYTGRGISVSDTARKTFLLGNELERVEQPILDWGLRTRHRGNRVYQLDEQGERSTPLPDQDVSRDVPGS
jgi:hypothetical protein